MPETNMNHIELMGPPGVGKSTLYSRIIERPEYYGGIQEEAIKRWMLQNAGTKYQLPYKIAPNFARSFFEKEFIEPRLKRAVFDDFVEEYPKFLEILSLLIRNSSYEPRSLYSSVKHAAEKYQLGKSTAQGDETLCLDESFAQRAVSMLWRFDESAPLKEYLRNTPTPRVVLYIDAPADICVGRQRDRGRITVSKNWTEDSLDEAQTVVDEICRDVREGYKNHTDTRVITIENTNSIDSTVDTILSSVKRI